MAGRFITFEGGEGAGKSTQIARLAKRLEGEGIPVVVTREPGGTPTAESIRRMLLSGLAEELGPGGEAVLFAAARADHVERLILPALASDRWVVCDRFLDSSLAYQGEGGGLGMEQVHAINAHAVDGLHPDLTLLLRTEPELGMQRANERDGSKDRFGARDLAFHKAVAEGFGKLAEAEPERFAIIDASDDIETVATVIQEIIQERLF